MLFRDDKYAYTHVHELSNLTRAYSFPPVGTWEKENVPPLPDRRSYTHLSYFLFSGVLATVASEWEPGLWGGGSAGI